MLILIKGVNETSGFDSLAAPPVVSNVKAFSRAFFVV